MKAFRRTLPIIKIGVCFGAHFGSRRDNVVVDDGSRQGELVSNVSQSFDNMLALGPNTASAM